MRLSAHQGAYTFTFIEAAANYLTLRRSGILPFGWMPERQTVPEYRLTPCPGRDHHINHIMW